MSMVFRRNWVVSLLLVLLTVSVLVGLSHAEVLPVPAIKQVEVTCLSTGDYSQTAEIKVVLDSIDATANDLINYMGFIDGNGEEYSFLADEFYPSPDGDYFLKLLPFCLPDKDIIIITYDQEGNSRVFPAQSRADSDQTQADAAATSICAGDWEGQQQTMRSGGIALEDTSVKFTVTSNQITKFKIESKITTPNCSSTSSNTIISATPITNNQFTLSFGGGEYQGTFSASDSCSGSWKTSQSYCGLNDGSWKATNPNCTPVPVCSSNLTTGDLNGDGRADLIGISSSGAIWYSVDFANWQQIPGQLCRAATGDLNGDGKIDLAGLSPDGHIYYTLDLVNWQMVPGILSRLTIGDFNGDGRADLAGVTSDGSIYYSLDLGNWQSVPGNLKDLTAGNFGGVGRAGLAGVAKDDTIWVTLDLVNWISAAGRLNQLTSGDFTGIGKSGLAGVTWSELIFYSPDFYTWYQTPGNLKQVAAGDFNGNGIARLVGLTNKGDIYYTYDLVNWMQIPGKL